MKRYSTVGVAAEPSPDNDSHELYNSEEIVLLVIGSLLMVALSLAGILYVERYRYRT